MKTSDSTSPTVYELGPTNARHSSASVEHFTPAWLVDSVRAGFGGQIDWDPASCHLAQEVVRASSFASLATGQDGLLVPWTGNYAIVNPPGGAGGKTVKEYWRRAVEYVDGGGSVVFVHFNFEQVATLDQPRGPDWYQIVVPRKRIAYDTEGVGTRPFADVAREELGKTASMSSVRERAAQIRAGAVASDTVARVPSTSPPHHSALTVMSDDPDITTALVREILAACLAQQGRPARVMVGVEIPETDVTAEVV